MPQVKSVFRIAGNHIFLILLFVLLFSGLDSSEAMARIQPGEGRTPTLPAAAQETPVLDELAKQSDWQPVSDQDVVDAFEQWQKQVVLSVEQLEAISRHLETSAGLPLSSRPSHLDVVTQAIAIGKPAVRRILEELEKPSSTTVPPTLQDVLGNASESAFVKNHVRLLFGRWLAQNEFYDEALVELSQLALEDVLDRQSLLFYRSLVLHQLLKKEECIESLERLLQHEKVLPQRFAIVTKMMLADVKPLKEDSLDEISRIMNDIRRRTGFNRSGKIVINQESRVIQKLDKLIEQLEAQQQQQQQQQQGAAGGGQPMQDSKNTGDKGDGKVARRDLPDGGNWGDLPPAKRAAALAEMAKDMPPHYRAAIEEYFRKLAKEDN